MMLKPSAPPSSNHCCNWSAMLCGVEVPDGQVFALRQVYQQLLAAFAAVRLGQRRQRSIHRVGRQVNAPDHVRQQRHAHDRMDQILERLEFLFGFFLRAPDDGEDARHDLDAVGVSAVLRRAMPDVAVELARLVERLMRHEDDFGRARRQVAASLGRAGLHHDRPALRRASDVQRAADGEVLALMVKGVVLAGIEEFAGVLVPDERVVFPGVPQARHDVFCASPSPLEVTRFQPDRPPLIRSSDANLRATW
ncbi:hypothetical protein G6F31_016567 [Rhizopus arrhizus]|nr:hypothetical protein G6F31_016567 [Rhizopus arrhizus]